MTATDRFLLKLWLALTLGVATAMLAGFVLVLLMLTGIGIPVAMLLTATPTLWLYATPPLVAYAAARFLGRASGHWVAPAIAALIAVAVGWLVPTVANRETGRRVAGLLAKDGGGEVALPRGASVVRLIDRGLLDREVTCHDDCQRLLLTGVAGSYADGARDLLSRLGDLPSPVTRFRLGPPDGRCRNDLLTPAYASDAEGGPAFPKPLLWDRLDDMRLCLHAEQVRDLRADYVMIETWNFSSRDCAYSFGGSPAAGRRFDFRLHTVERFRRWEVFRRRCDRLVSVMRRTHVRHAKLARPLRITTPFSFDTHQPGKWAVSALGSNGQDIKEYRYERWEPWITNDLTVTGL